MRPQKDGLFLARNFSDDGYRHTRDFARQAAGKFLRHGKQQFIILAPIEGQIQRVESESS
jgi:hypothetical protein